MLLRLPLYTGTILLLLAGCTDDASVSASESATWGLAPEPTLLIGQAGGERQYLLHRVRAAQILQDGQIVVADAGNAAIRIYDADGRFVMEVGREGDGPGEFREIRGLWVSDDELLNVYDAASGRVTRFARGGELVGTYILGQPTSQESGRVDGTTTGGSPPDLFIGRFEDGATAAAWTRPGPRQLPTVSADKMIMGWFNLDGVYQGSPGEFTGLQRHRGSPVPFTPFPHAVILRDTIYYTDGLSGEISVTDRYGSEVRKISLPIPVVDPEMAWSSLSERIRDHPDHFRGFLLPRVQAMPRDYRIPMISALQTDDEGHLWVKAFDPVNDERALPINPIPGHGGDWWIVTSAGTTIATLQMAEGVRPLHIRNGKLLGLHADEMGVERLVLHEIVR